MDLDPRGIGLEFYPHTWKGEAMPTVAPPTEASNAELVRWAFERLNAGDISALEQFWHDGTVERFPDRTCRGADEIAAYFEEALAAVAGFHVEVVTIAQDGDHVFVHWHLTGTHAGPLAGIEATGKPVAIDGIDHFVMRDGNVVSNFVVYDQVQYGRQLGMMPADGSPGDRVVKGLFNARTRLARRLKR